MIKVLGQLKKGYNEITDANSEFPEMQMDIGVYKLSAGESLRVFEDDKETAILLLSGRVTFFFGTHRAEAERNSLFDETPTTLHISRKAEALVTATSSAELLVQKTLNENKFPSHLYKKEAVKTEIFGENVWGDTARRQVRTVFDYKNAPYSNMVLGEVINYPGKWSSYIPHGHEQPEVYYYRFDRESGFGAAFLGDEVFKIVDNSAFIIPGGPTHPQVAAPGYAMWYAWMIRHLDNNPWTARVDDERHKWLLEADPKIWPNK